MFPETLENEEIQTSHNIFTLLNEGESDIKLLSIKYFDLLFKYGNEELCNDIISLNIFWILHDFIQGEEQYQHYAISICKSILERDTSLCNDLFDEISDVIDEDNPEFESLLHIQSEITA